MAISFNSIFWYHYISVIRLRSYMAYYKCIIKDSMDKWLTENRVYEGEPLIPPLTENESWIYLFSVDDGFPCYIRTKQLQRVFDIEDRLGV